MREIKLIAAVGRSGQLGLKGTLPWGNAFPEDLKEFRRRTTGGVVIVGGRTWPTVAHLQDTHGRVFLQDNRGVSLERFLEIFDLGDRPIWIGGGAKTYLRWLPLITEKVITVLDYDGPADLWMPSNIWKPEMEAAA